ncbi:MAG: DNA adenine methylase, partial [Dysgonamonadaceae bacterium]|nr:DNA adenine methylase [Dysgonamonadaceae bacterium]
MRTPITYYGGKQRIASEIISMIPGHKIYCEPFFGGGAVFFRKPKSGIEVINDHDNSLINFYTCVQNRFPELQELIKQTLHSESMYYHAKDIWNDRVE